jgi:hypothetical protein
VSRGLGDVYKRQRVGMGYRTSAYSNFAGKPNEPYFNWNVGAGYKKDDFYWDCAMVVTKNKEGYFLYNPNLISMANIDSFLIQMNFSVGIRF